MTTTVETRTPQPPPKSLIEMAEVALRQAVAGVIQEHRRLGEPLAIWRDGRVAMVAPDQLVLREEPVEYRAKGRGHGCTRGRNE